jgi:hypothetical protein
MKIFKLILAIIVFLYWIIRTLNYNLGDLYINVDYFIAYWTLNWAFKILDKKEEKK